MADSGEKEFKLVGYSNFKRSNPKSDRFDCGRFDHLEFWCADATSLARRFCVALGVQLAARSDLVTGNELYSSYVMRANDITFVCTSSMGKRGQEVKGKGLCTWEDFDQSLIHRLVAKHGVFVRAVGITVADAKKAHDECVANGGKSITAPKKLAHAEKGTVIVSEVELYEDVVLRFVQRTGHEMQFSGKFLPGYMDEPDRAPINYGLLRIDHVVSNVPSLGALIPRIMRMTGFHEFAEFVADDVGTDESGLNSIVLSSNDEMVLMPFNEPTLGKRKSQIQMFLDYNEGPGVQHIALKTDDIFATLRAMRENSMFGGLEFVPKPGKAYYDRLPSRLGNKLSKEEYAMCEEYGVLADTDPEGDLLQIFTRPAFDRPTVFFEIIQRIGCNLKPEDPEAKAGAAGAAVAGQKPVPLIQKPGCGGFGKGNFAELFKSIEDYEKAVEKVREDAQKAAALSITNV